MTPDDDDAKAKQKAPARPTGRNGSHADGRYRDESGWLMPRLGRAVKTVVTVFVNLEPARLNTLVEHYRDVHPGLGVGAPAPARPPGGRTMPTAWTASRPTGSSSSCRGC